MAVIPESKAFMQLIDKHHYQLVNPNRQFINYICKELKITRKRFKKLMKQPEFKQEMLRQLDKIK